MKKMRIISHRGAAGLALENTAASLSKAASLNVAAIEFDVRLTSDKQPIIFHDADLQRITGDNRLVNRLTLKQLRSLTLPDGSRIPTLREALHIVKDMPAFVEIKDPHSAELIHKEIKRTSKNQISIVSTRLDELRHMRQLDRNLPLYIIEHTHALDNIFLARRYKLNGVAMNFWLLNPLSYWYARRHHLAIYVYTVNNKPLARFLARLYPEVAICTDHPEWFVSRRRAKKAS